MKKIVNASVVERVAAESIGGKVGGLKGEGRGKEGEGRRERG